MFAVADPLLTFLVYFFGWHSVRGLARLKQQTKTSWLELVRQLAPLTLATLTIGFAGWSLLIMNQQPSDAMLRTLFIGLSAIAVPHLILHSVKGMGESLQPNVALGGGRPR